MKFAYPQNASNAVDAMASQGWARQHPEHRQLDFRKEVADWYRPLVFASSLMLAV